MKPDSAFKRAEWEGVTESERIAIGAISIQYAQLCASVMHPEELPGLTDFIPDIGNTTAPEPEGRSFDQWATVLLGPLTAGGN